MNYNQNQIIVECRELDSKNTTSESGDYTTCLNQNITLRDGDNVYVKNAFIASVDASEGKITLNDDVECTLNVTPYFFNYDETVPSTNTTLLRVYNLFKGFVDGSDSNDKQPDGNFYAPVTVVDKTPNMKTLESVLFGEAGGFGSRYIGPFNFNIVYHDINNDKQILQCEYPKHKSDSKGNNYTFTTGLPIHFLDATGGGITPTIDVDYKRMQSAGAILKGLGPIVDFVADSVAALKTFDLNFTVPKGEYDPDELSVLIARECSKNQSRYFTNDQQEVNSALLKTAHGPDLGADQVYITIGAETPNLVSSFKANRYIGSSQFGFVFDSDVRKFQFQAIHTPIYITSQLGICGRKTNNSNNSFIADTAGGAFVNSMQPSSFWFDLLGFNQDCQLSQIGSEIAPNIVDYANLRIPTYNIQRGINITSNFSGLDGYIKKGDDPDKQQAVETLDVMTNTTSTTVPIYGDKEFSPSVAKSGYFLVEVGCGFQNNFISENSNHSRVSAVVNRYYQSSSYTTGDVSSSIPYVHRGNPIQLKDFHIRILNPDKTLANINNDNTIMVAIEKAQPKDSQ